MRYEILVLVDGKWEVAMKAEKMSTAKGHENQLKLGGYTTKVRKIRG